MTYPACSIMSLGDEAIHKLVMVSAMPKDMKGANLATKSPLTQGLLLELLLKKAEKIYLS